MLRRGAPSWSCHWIAVEALRAARSCRRPAVTIQRPRFAGLLPGEAAGRQSAAIWAWTRLPASASPTVAEGCPGPARLCLEADIAASLEQSEVMVRGARRCPLATACSGIRTNCTPPGPRPCAPERQRAPDLRENRSGACVEVAGIEPASSGFSVGLLRAQPAFDCRVLVPLPAAAAGPYPTELSLTARRRSRSGEPH